MTSLRSTICVALLTLTIAPRVFAQGAVAFKVTTATVADSTTAIPGGTGSFIAFKPATSNIPPDPCMSAGNVTFWGEGSSGQQGIYAVLYGTLAKIVDRNTAIPGGNGNFVGYPPDPCISGANVAFFGSGASDVFGNPQQGIYLRWPPDPTNFPSNPVKIADLNTLIPDGTGTFLSLPGDPIISGQNVVFLGNGFGGQQGVYASFITNPFQPPDPIKIADLNTPVPGATGDFLAFRGWRTTPGAVINGSTVAFIGTSAGGGGIYVKTPVDPMRKAVDFNSAIPGGTGTFNRFWNLSLDGSSLAFVGGVETVVTNGDIQLLVITQQGVYTVAFPTDPTSGTPSDPVKIADLNTQVPGSTATFTAFGNVAIDPTHVVFDAWYTENGVSVHGLFTNLTGALTELVESGDTIGGKQLADFHFGVGGFSGTQVTYEAEFTDGTQSIATTIVSGNRCPLGPGYWKNHPSAWPATSLILGNQSYTQSELLSLLNTSTNSDASLVLAQHLIASKLDILNFSDPAPASRSIANADGLLAQYPGKLPYIVGVSTTAGKSMLADAAMLHNYDDDQLTPGCVQ
jgi:hypothetical protein